MSKSDESSSFHTAANFVGKAAGTDPDAWARAFQPDGLGAWRRDSGALLLFRPGGRDVSGLMIEYDAERGWSFFLRIELEGNQGEWASVGDETTMTTFTLTPTGATAPAGSFVAAATASAVVREYLKNPRSQPESVRWIENKRPPWPEDDY